MMKMSHKMQALNKSCIYIKVKTFKARPKMFMFFLPCKQGRVISNVISWIMNIKTSLLILFVHKEKT